MPRRKINFTEDQIYHICNRGVEKRSIFLRHADYFRFIHDLYEFNDEAPATLLHFKKPFLQSYEIRSHRITRNRKCIVEILAFALMPNHYHLLLRQKTENGIVNFMHKVGGGYAMYFNKKYQRVGVLFQGPFRAVHITREAHFLHLPFYIHANPLDLKFPTWRKHELAQPQEAIKFLESYRWSSFPDYIGKKNFPSVTQRAFLTDVLGKPKQYQIATLQLLKEMQLDTIRDVALEPIDE